MGLLTIYRADTDAVLASESRSSDPTATWVYGTFTGYRTWHCANKMMPQNLVIGGKTLNCANKVMPYNVKAYYRHVWAKYNAVLTYADTRTYFGDAPSSDYKIYESGNYNGKYIDNNNPSVYSFDTSTGKFSMGAGKADTPIDGYKVIANETEYISHIGSWVTYYGSEPTSYNNSQYDRIFEGASSVKWTVTSNYIRIENSNEYIDKGAYVHTATGSYSKGGTHYGDVESTSSNTYPSNGRHSDGYWYVKIY